MDRENYIAPIVETYIPDASRDEKLALTQELWSLFEALYKVYLRQERFDSHMQGMIESESPNQPKI